MKQLRLISSGSQFMAAAMALLGMGTVHAEEMESAAIPKATLVVEADSLAPTPSKKVKPLVQILKDFTTIDSTYIEPQHFHFTAMIQNTYSYEIYKVTTSNGYSMRLAPRPSGKLGPYFGWSWVFLGYMVDLKHMNDGGKREFDLSLYSSQVGVDLFYRQTGNDYHITKVNFGNDVDNSLMNDIAFDGLKATIKGFNLYYIVNHKHFSYPAAFSQSTVQRQSCGSMLFGIGYTRHSLDIDWNKLYYAVSHHMGTDIAEERLDKSLQFGTIHYTDVSLSGGYAYNWVFAHDWLLAASLSAALGYKQTINENKNLYQSFKEFSLNNMNIDGVWRFGVVWNNTRWYIGMSNIIHAYNYRKSKFSTINYFGTVNLYAGFNFMRKKDKKKK